MSSFQPLHPESRGPSSGSGGDAGALRAEALGPGAEAHPGARAGHVAGRATGQDTGGGGSPPNRRGAGLRVILVGRTGQDGVLRHDENIELVRAHNALSAISELANPMDEESPAAVTVLVGPDAVSEERARSFVASLRRIDPSVRVLVMSNHHMPVYDGNAPLEVHPATLRRLLRGVHAPEMDVLDTDEPPLDAGDEDAVLDALLAGRRAAAEPSTSTEAAAGSPVEETHASGDRAQPAGAIGWGGDALSPPPLPVGADVGATPAGSDLSLAPEEESGAAAQEYAAAHDRPSASEAAGREAGAMEAPDRAVLDASPVKAMLSGRPALEVALRGVSSQAGVGELLFIPSGATNPEGESGEASEAPPAPPAPPAHPTGPHIKVIHNGHLLGYLVSPTDAGAIHRLDPAHVEYLTAWAALDRHESQLREFAFMDELTGAYNRRFFNRFMASSLEAARNTRQFVTLLYFDIDDFKLYNDRFGHGAGDEILVSVVALLKSVIRPTDKVCRLGGDEFAVIFYDPSPASARPGEEPDPSPLRDSRVGGAPQSLQQIAERFQRQICSHRFPKLGEMAPGTLTVSGGMATYPWDGRTPEELLARADELLMGSKAKGKNLITLGPGSIEVCRGVGEPPSDLRG